MKPITARSSSLSLWFFNTKLVWRGRTDLQAVSIYFCGFCLNSGNFLERGLLRWLSRCFNHAPTILWYTVFPGQILRCVKICEKGKEEKRGKWEGARAREGNKRKEKEKEKGRGEIKWMKKGRGSRSGREKILNYHKLL